MTIRDYIKGKTFYSVIGLVLLMALPAVLRRPTFPTYFIFALSVAAMILMLWFHRRTVVCPRCKATLGAVINNLPDRCPQCGVSFDEPIKSR